jgi:hypothetical protein
MAKLFPQKGPFVFSPCGLQARSLESQCIRWTSRELLRYAVLVFYFFERELRGEPEEKQWDFYRLLSMFVQSKNPNQCRIFHKKVVENHGNLENLF